MQRWLCPPAVWWAERAREDLARFNPGTAPSDVFPPSYKGVSRVGGVQSSPYPKGRPEKTYRLSRDLRGPSPVSWDWK